MKFILLLLLFLSAALFGQVTVTDASIQAGQEVTWTSDNEYLMDGLVYVEDGAVLNILPGTVIRGKTTPTTGDNTSALVVAKGGKINAVGTMFNPIIFTAELDDLNDPDDFTPEDRGEWGGIILLGKASNNRAGGTGQIEGIDPNEPRGEYGVSSNPDDADNSGVMRYVSIRHAGAEIGSGNEINGLTMGSVGSGTTIEYIEVYANLDDGYEWFGGTVNTKYLVSAFCGDDAFDWDEGVRGKHQFWFALQSPLVAGRTAEMDGGTEPEDGQPFAVPDVFNATYIGPGSGSLPQGDGSQMLIFRDNTGGKYTNSIFTEYNGGGGGAGVTVEDLASGEDSRARLEAGELVLSTNVWWDFAAGNNLADFASQDFVQNHLAANNNTIGDPQLNGVSRTNDGGLDPRPSASGPAGSGAATVTDGFFTQTSYIGAFDPNGRLWTNGWTALWQAGLTGSTVTFVDGDINAGEEVTLSANNEYLMDGLVYVEDGAVLTIEAGTVIRGKGTPSTGDNTSALVIVKGGKIMAEGNANEPIVFTAELDDLNDPFDFTPEDRGEWGGIILLGKASNNRAGGTGQIEGIDPNEPRGEYGVSSNPDDGDNSGVMRYVSIRHAGAEIGSGNEINGLTMGSVGSGTTIEYIEVYANLDDGYEWFGGTVNTKYLVSAFCGDDAFDWDEGVRGKHQFWFALQSPLVAGRTAEMDGGTEPEDGQPFAVPEVFNATYIGPGSGSLPQGDGSQMLIFRDNTGGKYTNSIFTEYNGGGGGAGVTVEDLASGEDSRARLEAGELVLSTNVWWDFAAGNNLADFAPQDFVQNHLAANNNTIGDPQLGSVSRDQSAALDPRPAASGPAGSGAATVTDGFFTQTSYIGAFDPNAPLWTNGWTALWRGRVTGIEENRIDDVLPKTFAISQNYPNPFNPSTNIKFEIPKSAEVRLTVFNLVGQKVATLVNGVRAAGTYVVTWNASDVTSGVYFYRFESQGVVETKKMMLVK